MYQFQWMKEMESLFTMLSIPVFHNKNIRLIILSSVEIEHKELIAILLYHAMEHTDMLTYANYLS